MSKLQTRLEASELVKSAPRMVDFNFSDTSFEEGDTIKFMEGEGYVQIKKVIFFYIDKSNKSFGTNFQVVITDAKGAKTNRSMNGEQLFQLIHKR